MLTRTSSYSFLLSYARRNVCLSLKLKAIHRFTSTATAVEEITALQEQKLTKTLKKFLSEEVAGKGKSKETLAVFETGLGVYLRPSVAHP